MASSIHTVELHNATADFYTETKDEFLRFHTLKKEQERLEELISVASEGDTFWDVGANVGLYACLADALGKDLEVHAFEPHPTMMMRLEENLDLNGSDVETHEIGVWDRTGTGSITAPEAPPGFGGAEAREEDGAIEIDLRTGDSLVEEGAPPPDLLKIDVEGGERKVLAGLAETLSAGTCRYVQVEVHDREGSNPNGTGWFQTFLEDRGFEIEIHGRDAQRILVGKREPP